MAADRAEHVAPGAGAGAGRRRVGRERPLRGLDGRLPGLWAGSGPDRPALRWSSGPRTAWRPISPILVDVPVEVAAARLAAGPGGAQRLDRMERLGPGLRGPCARGFPRPGGRRSRPLAGRGRRGGYCGRGGPYRGRRAHTVRQRRRPVGEHAAPGPRALRRCRRPGRGRRRAACGGGQPGARVPLPWAGRQRRPRGRLWLRRRAAVPRGRVRCSAQRAAPHWRGPTPTSTWCAGAVPPSPSPRSARWSSLAQRRPLQAARQVIVVLDVHLAALRAPALLKTLEEPPGDTVFVLLADQVVPELVTVASRCVEVDFPPVARSVLVAWLTASGVDSAMAAVVADSSGGNPERARVMVDDPDVAARVELWASVPDELHTDGTTAAGADPARARRRRTGPSNRCGSNMPARSRHSPRPPRKWASEACPVARRSSSSTSARSGGSAPMRLRAGLGCPCPLVPRPPRGRRPGRAGRGGRSPTCAAQLTRSA